MHLYQFFKKMPELRKTASIFYEVIAQSCLQKSMLLRLVLMVNLEKRKRSVINRPVPMSPTNANIHQLTNHVHHQSPPVSNF
jgi:hypothetical protein